MERTDLLKEALCVGESEAERLSALWEAVTEANKRLNLTAITSEEDVLQKHFLDSAAGASLLEGERVADLGAGGGFPGLVLAVLRPGTHFTLLEATGKKADFLVATARALGLDNVEVRAERIEVYARGSARGRFDTVTARALAALNVLMEYGAPLLKQGGLLLAYKGRGYAEEEAQAENAAKTLGLKREGAKLYYAGGERALLSYRKAERTPDAYPRIYKKIKEKPL